MKTIEPKTPQIARAFKEIADAFADSTANIKPRTFLPLLGPIKISANADGPPFVIKVMDMDSEELFSFGLREIVKEHIFDVVECRDDSKASLLAFADEFEALAKKYRKAAIKWV